MRGNFVVFNSLASVLIDMGASHSFISTAFAFAVGLEIDQLESPLWVKSPAGDRVALGHVCCFCEIEVADCLLSFDFILLDMHTFDVILWMDWLSHF